MNRLKCIFLLCAAALSAACSTTRSLADGQYLLRNNKVEVNDKSFSASSLTSYIVQKPNSYLLGLNPLLSVYNWGGKGETSLQRFFQSFGTAPVVYQSASVDESIANIQNHLRYLGYYGSQVESEVQVKGRKVYVTYYVALGKRYKISAIDYDIPSYGTLKADFMADEPNIGIHKGDYLSESALEQEANRSAQYLRNLGYYGFTKSYYAFEADTLAGDSHARLTYSIRDYALGDTPAAAQEHKKFTLGAVSISHPQNVKIRPAVLESLNTLRPGQLYNEEEINTTYSRYSSVNMLSGVNINMTPVSQDKVDCNISLRNSGLQGFKTNLEASVNSTGLIGISPQLSYYHKNLFHGGELLNLGIRGNFQFKPGTSTRATDVSVTTSLRFPQLVGLPNRWYRGPYIPNTEVSAAFSYQNRPEFHRTVISTAFTYNGRLASKLFYQFTPFRVNIARVFDIADDFVDSIADNLYIVNLYSNNFDMGVSGALYYTTDASAIPSRPYHYARLSVDVSGNVLSLFNNLMPTDEDNVRTIWETPYAQYVRGELQLGKTFRFGAADKHALALRFLAGASYAYGNSFTAPLDRLFYAGGSTSMRGWQARTLGPGNETLLSELFLIPSQIGDMKLEANAEYRFPLFWKLEGGLFVDAGNIWDISGSTDDAMFSFKNLGESIGLDWGLGLRVNLDFILVRVDAGIRLHDPGRKAGDRWVPPAEWFKGNTAVHFGVGYPF
ncbi:MAG: BamA/TamA family outer membrane protein [Bacteroidales bacterium]|nr:BamA/TamA family outer membrane protein [Bacteroidales bacterium]